MEPKPVRRKKFTEIVDPGMKNEKGLIVGVPEGYDPKLHLAPRRTDFADDADYLEFQANVFDAVAKEKQARAQHYRAQAEERRKYGDPAQLKEVQKFQKIVANLKELQGNLNAAGVQISLEDLLTD